MAVMGVSSIAPAFPKVIEALDVTQGQIGLLITFFTLPGVVLAPGLGVMADRFGRKRVLGPSLLLFALAGTACAFARDFILLLILRTLQGIGGASLGSLNTTIIGDIYSGEQRSEAMGLNASVLSIGTAFYPTIGGALALMAWYYPFLLPVIALPIGILVLTVLESPEPRSHQPLKKQLSGTWSYLKNTSVLGLFTASILTFLLLYGTVLTYFTLLLSDVFNASSFVIGLMFTAMSLATAAVSWQLGAINRKITIGNIIRLSFVCYGLAFLLIPYMPNIWWLLVPTIIYGIAHGGNIPGLHTAVASAAPLEYRAAFMSLNAMVLRLGQSIGPPVMALVYIRYGFEGTFIFSGVIALLTAAIAFGYALRRTG